VALERLSVWHQVPHSIAYGLRRLRFLLKLIFQANYSLVNGQIRVWIIADSVGKAAKERVDG
jgi:hypothetical protein